jgi:hypothetical protein
VRKIVVAPFAPKSCVRVEKMSIDDPMMAGSGIGVSNKFGASYASLACAVDRQKPLCFMALMIKS